MTKNYRDRKTLYNIPQVTTKLAKAINLSKDLFVENEKFNLKATNSKSSFDMIDDEYHLKYRITIEPYAV